MVSGCHTRSFFESGILLPGIFFFLAPVPGVTCVGHSGLYAKARENEFLQDYPEYDKPCQDHYFFHDVISM
jgi:hypothetical protein